MFVQPQAEMQDGGRKTHAGITFERLRKRCDFNFNPHFFGQVRLAYTLSTYPTFPDVGRLPNSDWRPWKPELEITIERNELATRFKGNPYICDQAGHVPNTPDITRRWLVTEIQNDGH